MDPCTTGCQLVLSVGGKSLWGMLIIDFCMLVSSITVRDILDKSDSHEESGKNCELHLLLNSSILSIMLLRFFAEKNPIFKAMRQVGQGLDLIGRKLEVNPWVDKCEFFHQLLLLMLLLHDLSLS